MKKQNCLITSLALALMVTTVPVNATNTTTVAPIVTTTTTTTEATVTETVVKEETATLDLSGYTNDKLNVYENSRATKIYYDSNKNTLTIEGYAFVNGKNFDKANGLWREVILVNADNTSTDYAYREQVTSVAKGQFLTSNKNINPNGNLNYTYAMYTVTLDLNKMKKYDNKTYESLKGGNYLIYIRCSDGKDGKLMPLQNITLSDGSRMDLPEQFKSIDYTNSLGVSIGGERAVPELEKPIVTFVDNKLAGQKPEPTPTPETEKQEEKPKKPSGGGSGGSGGGGGGGGSSSRPDTQKPTVSIVSLGTNETNGSIYINVRATDNKGVTGYAISTRNSATYDDLTWQSSSQFVVDEYGTYYVYATDAKKNMSYVKAVVSIPTYTITYVTDGGSVAETAKTSYERGTSAEVTNVVAIRNGYTFDRWYSDAALTVPATDITTSDYGNKTYYAKFTPNTYNIQYVDSMNGTLDGTNPTTFTTGGDDVTLVSPTKDGYNFDGWMVNGNKYTTITADMFEGLENGETITLTSEWSIISYDITYVMDGGINSNTNPTTYTIESEEFTLVNPTKAGFTFDNWYSDAEFNTVADTTVEHGSTGNKTYYAKFNPNTYNIQYVDSVNGTLDGTNPTTFTTGGDDATLVSPTKEGYNFIGWVYDGTLYHYIYANMFEGLEDDETITLTASWEVIDYEISYVNVETHNNPTSYNVETNSFTLINPTKEWHNFLGWTTDGVDEPTLTMVVDTSTIGNKEYEAHFEPVTFTINYSMDGGVTSEELVTSYVYGSNAIINLEEPTKETVNGVYYVFNGYRLEDGEVISVINKRNVTEFVDSNNVINIEATWIPHSISSEEALSDSTTAAKFALYGLEHYHYDTNSDDYYWLPEFEEANSLYGNELIDQFEFKDSAEIVEYADYVNEYVNAIEGMLPLGTTQEKALALADLIMNGNDTLGIEGIYYQADINADNYVTIEDAVTVRSEETGNRVTNCQGHARLFNAVARKLGIVSASVTGVSKSTGVAHMWNLVYDDGNYYEIDVVQVGTHTEYSGTAGYWSPEGEQQALYNNTDYDYAKEFLQLLVNSTIYDLN